MGTARLTGNALERRVPDRPEVVEAIDDRVTSGYANELRVER